MKHIFSVCRPLDYVCDRYPLLSGKGVVNKVRQVEERSKLAGEIRILDITPAPTREEEGGGEE